jgi:hypothetical protein
MANQNNKWLRTWLTGACAVLAIIALACGTLRTLPALEKFEDNVPAGQTPPVLHLSEATIIKDITISGLVRHRSGNIQRTYGGKVKPAALCPT